LPGGDGHPLEQREALSEGLVNPEGVFSGTASIRRQAAAPGIGLRIERREPRKNSFEPVLYSVNSVLGL
jgi:hypothetical protein